MMGLEPLQTALLPSFCQVGRQEVSSLQLGRGTALAPRSQTSRLRNREKLISLVSKPPGLQYSVTAARAKTGGCTPPVNPNGELMCRWLEGGKE